MKAEIQRKKPTKIAEKTDINTRKKGGLTR